MAKTRIRFKMFYKFWIGCTLLAALLIAGGMWVVQDKTKQSDRGNYLQKHFLRYQGYLDFAGQTLWSAAELFAGDTDLVRALGAAPQAGAPDGAEPPADGGPARPEPSAAEVAERMFAAANSPRALRPDLFVVLDQSAVVWNNSAAGDTSDLAELEEIALLRSGKPLPYSLLAHGGQVYQTAGVPIRDPRSKRVLGGLLIGIDLTRVMEAYRDQSDESKGKQHQPTLFYDGAVVASVHPGEEWAELTTQLREDSWGHEEKGDDARAVIDLKRGAFDFYHSDVDIIGGLKGPKTARMFLLRTRTNLAERDAYIPWREMTIGAILSLLVAFLLGKLITRPINRFVTQSRLMLEGGANLNQRIEVRSHDEVADLAENINLVFERLYMMASRVQSAAFQVGASSAEISAASKQMLDGLKDQTLKIESSTAAVTELSASIQQVAGNAVEATKAAEKSNVAVTAAVQRMQQIRSTVEGAAQRMQELGDSSKRIGNIVEVIHQISEQTSLLALNASIEAAHAGEQGRGFAVVADEVSSLARRVGQSAKDIEALIQSVKEKTTEAMHSMQKGTTEVESGTELVTATLTDLQQLITVVNDTATAVQEQAEVSDEIARNMDAVQKIAGELVTGSAEAVEQGEQLHTLAFNLEESVGGFNLDTPPQPASGAKALRSAHPE